MDMLSRLNLEDASDALSSSCPTSFDFAGAIKKLSRQSARLSLDSLSGAIDIRGQATLCLGGDGRAFRGVVAAVDGCHYSVEGTRTPRRKRGLDCSQQDCSATRQIEETPFDIRIKDYDNPTADFTIRRVTVTWGDHCTISCPSLKFSSESMYKGERAKILTKESLGNAFEGEEVQVYVGTMSVTMTTIEEPHHWVM